MGALTESRKRLNDVFGLSCAFSPPCFSNPGSPFEVPPSKKPRVSFDAPVPEKPLSADASKSITSRFRSLPPPQPLPRAVHGPQRIRKFFRSANSVSKSQAGDEMGNFWSRMGCLFQRKETGVGASGSLRNSGSVVTSFEVEGSQSRDVVAEGLSVEEYKRLVKRREGIAVVLDSPRGDVHSPRGDVHVAEPKPLDVTLVPSSSALSELTVLTRKIDNAGKMAENVSVNRVVGRLPVYKELYESSKRRDSKLSSLDFEVRLAEQKISAFKLMYPMEEAKEDVAYEPFVPLTDDEEDCVSDALSGYNRRELLVAHESSNIEITREVLQCLGPGAWLNDEVINLYLELLKEREKRNPGKFLKCHFFNTFFYKKLISGRTGYDYKAVRRWTTQRKIGYGLIECDKLFVPIHKDIHWCLAVINVKEEKIQYLDSLGGMDPRVLKVLARYFVDEVKDKSNKDVDVSSWKMELVDDLPEQENGWDCGMFMLKYIDFYSRGLTLCFNQEHMPYFRRRTVMEILRLRAE